MIHELKTAPPYYGSVASGVKTFDVRPNDRPFTAGDTLRLREYADGAYTGRECARRVTYVLDDPQYVLPGTVVLALAVLEHEWAVQANVLEQAAEAWGDGNEGFPHHWLLERATEIRAGSTPNWTDFR